MKRLPDPEQRILRALLSMVVADGDIDPDELITLARVYSDLTGRARFIDDLETQGYEMLAEEGPGYRLPDDLGENLPQEARLRVLAAAFAIAAADGFVLEEEDAMLARFAKCLGLTDEDYRAARAGQLSVRPRSE